MASPNTTRKAAAGVDLYNTPVEAVTAAIGRGIFDGFNRFWDPCDGLGGISHPLIDARFDVVTSDLIDYGLGQDLKGDFLKAAWVPSGVDCIVMNPPFLLTEQFISKALEVCPSLIMFNRATVLESKTRSRKHDSGAWPLKRFYSFGNRVSCSKGIDKEPQPNSVWYGWFVYERGYQGAPSIEWLFTK